MQYKAIAIVLAAITALLAFFIVSNSLGKYQSSKSETESLHTSIDCVGYIYSINALEYDNSGKNLQITFENKGYSDKEVEAVTIWADTGQNRTIRRVIPRGSDTKITVNSIEIEKNFSIYPEGCSVFAKTCTIQTGECLSYQPPSYEQ